MMSSHGKEMTHGHPPPPAPRLLSKEGAAQKPRKAGGEGREGRARRQALLGPGQEEREQD